MTLTQTAILTKQVIVASIITLILSIGGVVGYQIWYANYLSSLPPVEEKPDLRFGALPQPNFPKSNVTSSNFTYSLDTVTGSLPEFKKIIKVYYVPRSYATLLSGEKSQNLASKFLIKSSPQILSETVYKFEENNKSLTVNLDTGNFKFINTASISAQVLGNDNNLTANFLSMLQNLSGNSDTFGRTKITYLKIIENDPQEVNRENANAAEISIWPQAIEEIEIFTPNFNKSLINARVVGAAEKIENYKAINYTNWTIDTTTFATYPLKPVLQAFEDLKSGKGIVVKEPFKPQVSISAVSLGYYLSDEYSQYLLPIYIFEGPEFVSYISAITESELTPAN